MSSHRPDPHEPDRLHSDDTTPSTHRPRRPGVLVAAVVAVAGVLALGGWAATSLMSSGAKPAEVVPANAIGFLSVDLDPSATQKVEAVRMLRKFPSLREELEISDRDDLRRWAFETLTRDGSCQVDYETDVEPWLGERLAVAGVPSGPEDASPVPVVAVQVTDTAAAAYGIEALVACGEGDGDRGAAGVALVGDYALVSDTQEHADDVARSAERASLADDPDYQKWMKRVGQPGIMTMYVAPGAMAYLSEVQEQMADRLADGSGARWGSAAEVPEADMAAVRRHVERLSGDFEGLAAAVRFVGGAVEVEVVGESARQDLVVSEDRAGVTDLPADTAVALGVSLPDGWARSYLDLLAELSTDGSVENLLRDAEAITGLRLPEDLERLLGDGVTLSVDARLDPASASATPTAAPVGLRIAGDPAEITAVVDRLRARFGPQTEALVVEEGDGVVAVGADPGYVSELAGPGTLGTQAAFRDVVPEAERAGGTVFVDFDAVERWVAAGGLPGRPVDASTMADLEPLTALGVSFRVDDDGSERALLRLSVD